ncbi:MAG: tRNA preQ1(34) S-adenosylmethionine ribosyltransferase-isomerase QueA [Spirochaetales bacterium]|nr:tRNA preQ1(34) S-adenosylmethionine ribosyltransferase-isomerase QueA [Spirochaetales bacterium]
METRSFSFNLPPELIAQHPPENRGASRLMVVDRASGSFSHRLFDELPILIPAGSLVVFNNARVRKARLRGTRAADGGECEVLLLEETEPGTWKAIAKPMKKLKAGTELAFPGGKRAGVLRREGDFLYVKFDEPPDEAYFEAHGAMPLPPYIRRPAGTEDDERYQTVYASAPGSAAAPTAGLHFTDGMRERLREAGLQTAELTLHVGSGTFLPIRAEKLEDHVMHEERYTISDECAGLIASALAEGKPITAVGTTTVRALESSAPDSRIEAGTRRTSLFIRPGFEFRIVSHLLTNFHTPLSSLLVLVSAFAGKDLIFSAYEAAVRERYRFFSYGDAMLIV